MERIKTVTKDREWNELEPSPEETQGKKETCAGLTVSLGLLLVIQLRTAQQH